MAILASGPSLSAEAATATRRQGVRALAVNDGYRLAPWADALYACDPDWWDVHKGVEGFAGERWTQSQEAALKFNLRWVRSEAKPGLSLDPHLIHQGGNSGYQALNLAVLFGAARILLLGFDMKADQRRMHWFGDHPGRLKKCLPFAAWIQAFGTMAADLKKAGVEVLNCTPGSALTCFPKVDLAEALKG